MGSKTLTLVDWEIEINPINEGAFFDIVVTGRSKNNVEHKLIFKGNSCDRIYYRSGSDFDFYNIVIGLKQIINESQMRVNKLTEWMKKVDP